MSLRLWSVLLLAQLREQPGRLLVTVLAIALGVALGESVYLVNATALNEFGLATKRLVGEADIIVRGSREGFPEALYPALARDPAIAVASPILELEAALPGRRDALKILGLDPFLAASLQPALLGGIAGGIFDLLTTDGIFLSGAAARQLNLRRGDVLTVTVGSSTTPLRVLGILTETNFSEPLGVMDIASVQWAFNMLGRLNRVDLRLAAGTSVDTYRGELERRLPPGVLAIAPKVERDRAVTVTRAYRVNLNMLALVALWTGAFLVFSTQSLSVLRRRRSLALLRAMGVTRAGLQWALAGEGAALGVIGSLLGVMLGFVFAAAMLRVLTGDLGLGQLHAMGATVHAAALPLSFFFVVGTCVASAGAWMPARSASRQPPARSLKGGDGDYGEIARMSWHAGLALLLAGALFARLPAVAGLPLFGYASIAALLFGAVLLVPVLTIRVLALAPRTNRVVWDAAIAQLRENVGLSTLSLASIIVSFSLMVAMAIMVYSFRVSFEHWLGKLLPADLQIREPLGNDTAYWSPSEQAKLASVPGIERLEFRRTQQILLDAGRPAVTLIARGATPSQAAGELPLVQTAAPVPGDPLEPVWISEALQDLYGLKTGSTLTLPLAGHDRNYRVAGVWRDYARTFGAVVMTIPAYSAATGDRSATEGSVWLDGRRTADGVVAGLRACFVRGDMLEVMTTTALRERSLQIFDHAFAITYALEGIAVLIGLTGISFAAGATALARRSEFGMLRHIGMLRRQVVGLLASEGFLMSVFGVLYGLTLGAVLSLVLVYVVNRQSFNWSIDLEVPAWQLGALSVILIAAAAFTAVWSGRAATSKDAVQAVREDW
ncbi:MAG: putative transport system permease protein [Gammaproteobacteria bacterium]|nr:putative transport system permease protein [Gammaproteobacteria bacterium]